jgi:hypothetical protein
MKIDQIAKAIVAGATALGGTFVVASADGVITAVEYVGIVVATVVATVGVWATTNEKPPTPPSIHE